MKNIFIYIYKQIQYKLIIFKSRVTRFHILQYRDSSHRLIKKYYFRKGIYNNLVQQLLMPTNTYSVNIIQVIYIFYIVKQIIVKLYMHNNSDNCDTPLPDALNQNYSSFLYGEFDPNRNHNDRNPNQYFEYPETYLKRNIITDAVSPRNTNFLTMNIWNESPLNIIRNFQYDNANDHFDDINVYQMFKDDTISNHNNKVSCNVMPKKKVNNLNSVAMKLDFNDCGIPKKQQKQEKKEKISNKILFNQSFIQQTAKKQQRNKIHVEESESSKKSKETIVDSYHSNSNKRNSKGLRNLSETVRQIVQEAKVTTYKEVADKLIYKLDQQKKISLDPNSKDQQNVKRRVYDALNVLISADILRKQGKNVMVESESNKIKKGKEQVYKEQIAKLADKTRLSKMNIIAKYEKLENLRKKYNSISNLISRNKQLQKKGNLKKIHFPFIGLIFKPNSIDKKSTLNKSRINFKFEFPFTIIGDIDTLLKLNMKLNSHRSKLPKQIMDYNCQILKQEYQIDEHQQ